MTAALHQPPSGEWTTDDLDALPDDGRRRELLDGVLLVPASPTAAHQTIAMRLGVALEAECPDEYEVTQGVEVRTGGSRPRRPVSWYTPTGSIRCTRSTPRPDGGPSSSTPASHFR
ncbi:hypothetical protein [Micromonospora gifhornensis]|uniref:Uma2 family endonuclease n=1 Tax=Micromonospora gifhornensis TaxID=84594 RepID=UPI0031DD2C76